jgi:type II secretory ATPase GspE/PulE/Tfp pilus assembly ATPase PilB-like protein
MSSWSVKAMRQRRKSPRAAMTGISTLYHPHHRRLLRCRLIDIGVEPFLVASVSAVVAQRIRNPTTAPPDRVQSFGIEQLGFDVFTQAGQWRRAVGCRMCRGTGYSGQIGVFEMFALNDALRQLISDGQSAAAIREYLGQGGFESLRDQARGLVASGLTTAEEVLRVIPRRTEVWDSVS